MKKNLYITLGITGIIALSIWLFAINNNQENNDSFSTQSVKGVYNDQAVAERKKIETEQSPVCGNGIIEGGEQCDHGSMNGVEAQKNSNGEWVFCNSACKEEAELGCEDAGRSCTNENQCDGRKCNGTENIVQAAGSCIGLEPCPQISNESSCKSITYCNRSSATKTTIKPGICGCSNIGTVTIINPCSGAGIQGCGNGITEEELGEECDFGALSCGGLNGGFHEGTSYTNQQYSRCGTDCKFIPKFNCPKGGHICTNTQDCDRNGELYSYCKKPQDTPKGLCSGMSPCPQITDEKSCKSISYCNRGSYDSSANEGICTCDGF